MILKRYENNMGWYIRAADNDYAPDIMNTKEKAIFRHCANGRDAVPASELMCLLEVLKMHNIDAYLPIG
jgi:hypothetical protein